MLIASIGTAASIGVTVLIPVPYVILGPGPTLNTLGKDSSGQQLISIQGRATHPTSGHLNMVTVSYAGGPGSNLNIFSALAAWLNPSEAVVPESELFPPGTSQQQVQQQDTAQMASSQQIATAAAFNFLHIPFTTEVTVGQTVPGTPAARVLRAGDIITSLDGKPVPDDTALTNLIRSHPAGTTLNMTIERGGKTEQVQVTSMQAPASSGSSAHPIIGVGVVDQYKFPFTVKISIGDIGGPSAGTMFALAIIDKLTTDDLTGGKFIAGTGEITPAGQVQPIGGIQQKMAAARSAGATVFLTPADNCSNTAGAVPAGLRIVKVSTLSQAVSDLEAIKAGKSVPSC